MNDLSLIIVNNDEISTFWPACAPFLALGLADSDGEMSTEHLLPLLKTEQGFLLIGLDATGIVQAAMVLQLQNYPQYTVAHIFSIGGRGVLDNRRHWVTIKAWLKQQGASKVQGSCKPAQARLWRRIGLKPAYTIMSQDL